MGFHPLYTAEHQRDSGALQEHSERHMQEKAGVSARSAAGADLLFNVHHGSAVGNKLLCCLPDELNGLSDFAPAQDERVQKRQLPQWVLEQRGAPAPQHRPWLGTWL